MSNEYKPGDKVWCRKTVHRGIPDGETAGTIVARAEIQVRPQDVMYDVDLEGYPAWASVNGHWGFLDSELRLRGVENA